MGRWPLTLRGSGALAVAVVAFIVAAETGVVELMFFGVLLLALIAGSVASLWAGGVPAAGPRRLVPEVGTVGTPTRVSVTLTAPRRMSGRTARWRDTVPASLAGPSGGELEWPAVQGGRCIVEYTVTPQSRGLHPLGPLRVWSTDPFGIARRAVQVLGAGTLRAAPAERDLPAVRGVSATSADAVHATLTQRGHGVDNLLARPYQPGDSMRRIHWRASAHHDGLMVRQEENEAAPDATVVIDRDRTRWGPGADRVPGADPGFEAAVSACVSAVSQLSQEGYTVTVLDAGGRVLQEAVDPADRALLDAFAAECATILADSTHGIPDIPRAFATTQSGPVVVITGPVDETDVAALAPLGAHTTLPILLSTALSPAAAERAGDLGWRCAAVRTGQDMPGWWDSAPAAPTGRDRG